MEQVTKVTIIGHTGLNKSQPVYRVMLKGKLPAYIVTGREMKYMSERRGSRGQMLRRWLPVISSTVRASLESAVREFQLSQIE